LGDAEQFAHWQIENAESVCLPDAEMDTQSGWRNHPPVETFTCHDVVTVEYRQKTHCLAPVFRPCYFL
jgi:hypothetical protein